MEKTLIIFKPDALERKLVYLILDVFLKNDFKIETIDFVEVSEKQICSHYYKNIESSSPEIRERIVDFFVGKNVIPIILSGKNCIYRVRELIGTSDPSKSPLNTIRGFYCDDNYEDAEKEKRCCRNIIHASDSQVECEREIKLWLPNYVF